MNLPAGRTLRQAASVSQQHLREFEVAGLAAELFQKDGAGLFTGHRIEILDIHKLKDGMGDKTIAIDVFEGSRPRMQAVALALIL